MLRRRVHDCGKKRGERELVGGWVLVAVVEERERGVGEEREGGCGKGREESGTEVRRFGWVLLTAWKKYSSAHLWVIL